MVRITHQAAATVGQGAHHLAGATLDVSEGGMLFLGVGTFPVGTEITFTLALQSGPIAGNGEVRRHVDTSDGVAMGIRFVGLGVAAHQALQAFVASA